MFAHTEEGWVYQQDIERRCGSCGGMVRPIARETDPATGTQHWRKSCCPTCGWFMGWAPKPPDDPTKYRPARSSVDLVKRYSRGYCEFCLRFERELPAGHGLEAHHVRPHQYGGPDTRENLWIVCKACHRLIEHTRTYHGPSGAMEDRPW